MTFGVTTENMKVGFNLLYKINSNSYAQLSVDICYLKRRSPVHKSQQYVTQQGQCQQFTVHSQHIHVNIVVSKF